MGRLVAGPVVYFTPQLHHHYEMSSQAHHDVLRSVAGGGAADQTSQLWTVLSLVINITRHSITHLAC